MTVIKKLRLKGFKSFNKLTEIPFGNGFNIILGPNGAGKSNVTDSLSFVLGKASAKSLRAEKSANLIFHGGKKGSPSKEARVDITFDNSSKVFPIKEKEVNLTRIVRKSGNSIYKINDDIVTRQQMIDLLSAAKIDPDGHNIILQGDIIKFAEMKPMERREIIEEVSGISVYEDKKMKALNELDKVDKKLNDASIILAERETYLKELRKERDQALKYRELEKNIGRNKATHLNLEIKERDEKKGRVEKSINEFNSKLEKINNDLEEIKQDILNKKEEIKRLNKDIEERGEVEQKKLYKEIENLKTEIVKLNSRKDVCKNEITKIGNRAKQLDKNLKDIKGKVSELNKEKQRLEKRENLLKTEEQKLAKKLKELRSGFNEKDQKRIEDIENEVENKQAELSKINSALQEKLREKDKIEFQLSNVDIKDVFDKINNLKQKFKETTLKISKALNEDSSLSSQLNKARSNLLANKEEFGRLQLKNISAKERDVFSLAIKKVLDLGKGIYGTVSDLGKVNSRYSAALGVAAGSRMNSVVVEDEKTAQKCIDYLKEKKLGVVTFLPLSKIKGRGIHEGARQLKNLSGVKDLAINLVSFDEKFRNVFSYVFGSTMVVENLDVARKVGVGRARMVTLEGDLVELSGAMVGGYRKKAGGFREKEVSKDINKINADIERLTNSIDELEKKKVENEELIYELKNNKSKFEGEIIKLESITGAKDEKELMEKASNIEKRFKDINKEIEMIEKDSAGLEEEIQTLRKERKTIRDKIRSSEQGEKIKKAEEEQENNRNELIKVSSELKNLEVQVNDIYAREEDRTSQISKSQDKERSDFQKELEEIEKEIKEKSFKLKEKELVEKKFYSEFKSLFNKRKNFNEDINKKENKIASKEEKIKLFERRINNSSLEKAKIVAELEGLNKEFEEFKEVKLRRGINIDQLKYEISQFERSLKTMGNVNLRALEIYENVEKEYRNILEKVDKLKLEKEDVLVMMKEIDDKKKDLFMKTFNTINKNFQRIFSDLSTKGTAHLEIEDHENLFDSGIDIKVKIIGKKFLDIRSLSGGEKTMTALAFIFSIQEYDPAPFYLLDEVDAALDKTNSDLLSKLIQKYSANAQYIVISHNDTVISEAEYIYGVSMQNEISKVVSLKI